MTASYDALQIPPGADQKGGIEVLRAGVVDGGLHVTLRRAFNDPKAWGILLADVARQVARVYAQEGDEAEENVADRIRDAFAAEMDAPANSGTIAPGSRKPAATTSRASARMSRVSSPGVICRTLMSCRGASLRLVRGARSFRKCRVSPSRPRMTSSSSGPY